MFFETAAVLFMFLCLGKFLETYAKGRTSGALLKLMELSADSATLVHLDHDGQITQEFEVTVEEVLPGDHVKVVPGSKVPVDGQVVSGCSAVNEAMITGESVPVTKQVGDKVTGGTVNGEGVLFVRCTKVGTDSTLGQIVKLVEDAQTSQAPVQRIADNIAAYFVPVEFLLFSPTHTSNPTHLF